MTQVAALILLVFGLLPIANWIPGGHDAPWYGERLSGWLSGGAIVLGVAIIAGDRVPPVARALARRGVGAGRRALARG